MADVLNDIRMLCVFLDYPKKCNHMLTVPFEEFYKKPDREKIVAWITKLFKKPTNIKNDRESDRIRKEGNNFYIKGDWQESLKCYTDALSMATENSKSYGLALANRSATFFSVNEFEYSLMDIDRCLKSKYPDDLKHKVYIRKIQCYYKLGSEDLAKIILKEALLFLENNNKFTTEEKDVYKKKVSNFEKISPSIHMKQKPRTPTAPNLMENPNFSGASNLLKLVRKNSNRGPCSGRHVVAQKDIKVGEVLFAEKPIGLTPVFDESYKLPVNKCFHCLLFNKALIPCKNCTLCFYCNETCRTNSWNDYHKWECKGMTVNLWGAIGYGFPAFRTLLQGIPSKFENGKYVKGGDGNNNDVDMFGSKTDNYKYANMLFNEYQEEQILDNVVTTGIVITYLETQTDFFEHILDEVKLTTKLENLKIIIGNILCRHIAQVNLNGSLIEHYKLTGYTYVPRELQPVAVGLYPSISMMNHSCKSNASGYFVNDVQVVIAAEDIKKGDQVFNCYGADYRQFPRDERRKRLLDRYHFDCECEICSNPNMELEYLDSLQCTYCTGPISYARMKCISCNKVCNIKNVMELEERVKKYFDQKKVTIEDTNKCYEIMKKIYTPYHKKIGHCYMIHKTYHLQNGQYDKAMQNFKKYLDSTRKRLGEHSWGISKDIILFLHELKECRATNKSNFSKIKKDVKELYDHVMKILPLDYPDAYINHDKLKALQFLNN